MPVTNSRQDWRGDEWEQWGRRDPYFGVISAPKFRSDRLDEAARLEFFQSGEREIAATLSEVRRLLGEEFRPKRVLDFGCGVGRLTIPLAHVAERVLGVDVSPSMIAEAQGNCVAVGVENVTFRASMNGIQGGDETFDFVHSFIVFQHIPPAVGYPILDGILDRVETVGAGMLHITYAKRIPTVKRLAQAARRSSRVAHRLLNLVQGRPASAPLMAMFEYDLTRILESIDRRGFNRIMVKLTDHDGCHGAMIFFARDSR